MDNNEQRTINLPMYKKELVSTLRNLVGTDDATQIVVYDLLDLALDNDFSHNDIYEVNALAFVYEEDYDDDFDDAVNAWIYEYGHSYDAVDVANILLNADAIPWYGYSGYDGSTPEERFGRFYLNEYCPDEAIQLDAMHMISHINYESYGKDMAEELGVDLFDNGYLNMCQNGPRIYDYDLDELLDKYLYDYDEEEDE